MSKSTKFAKLHDFCPQLCLREVSKDPLPSTTPDRVQIPSSTVLMLKSAAQLEDTRCVENELMLRSQADPLNQDLQGSDSDILLGAHQGTLMTHRGMLSPL